jgi:hypothetical protein
MNFDGTIHEIEEIESEIILLIEFLLEGYIQNIHLKNSDNKVYCETDSFDQSQI